MSERFQAAVVSCLRYRDALKAIDWLCDVFGFSRQAVFADGQTVHHAQLTLGRGMIMLGSVSSGSEYGKLTRQPDEVGGFETQSAYLVVADADAAYAKARAAGATIVIEIQNREYGGRDFTCRDPEGHVWSVGTYDPWKTV